MISTFLGFFAIHLWLSKTPNFGGPGFNIGASTFGVVTKTQANNPRIGQMTARINF